MPQWNYDIVVYLKVFTLSFFYDIDTDKLVASFVNGSYSQCSTNLKFNITFDCNPIAEWDTSIRGNDVSEFFGSILGSDDPCKVSC